MRSSSPGEMYYRLVGGFFSAGDVYSRRIFRHARVGEAAEVKASCGFLCVGEFFFLVWERLSKGMLVFVMGY